MDIPFRNRSDAGKKLAVHLLQYANRPDTIVLALPRGGVPVAFEVARQLSAPLALFLVRKLGVPGREELAMGAIASGGLRVLNREIVEALGVDKRAIEKVTRREQLELDRREQLYRARSSLPDPRGRVLILVDDGLATGSTMRAAVMALRQRAPARIVVAVPVAAPETCGEFESAVDEIVCLETPEPFRAVGAWYEDFSQTTDEEIRALLAEASNWRTAAAAETEKGGDAPRGDLRVMKASNIERNQWESFMDEFSRLHDGWLATIEVSGESGHKIIASNLAFEGISAEVGVGGRDYVNIRVGRTEVDSITHRIASPQRVRFLQTDGGAHEGVEIDGADASKTVVRFSAPAKPGELNGVPEIGL